MEWLAMWKKKKKERDINNTSRGKLMKSSEGFDCISFTSCRIRFTAGFFRLYLSAITPYSLALQLDAQNLMRDMVESQPPHRSRGRRTNLRVNRPPPLQQSYCNGKRWELLTVAAIYGIQKDTFCSYQKKKKRHITYYETHRFIKDVLKKRNSLP